MLLREELIFLLNLRKHYNPFDVIKLLSNEQNGIGTHNDLLEEFNIGDFESFENYSEI
jgi:hypothetical protein